MFRLNSVKESFRFDPIVTEKFVNKFLQSILGGVSYHSDAGWLTD